MRRGRLCSRWLSWPCQTPQSTQLRSLLDIPALLQLAAALSTALHALLVILIVLVQPTAAAQDCVHWPGALRAPSLVYAESTRVPPLTRWSYLAPCAWYIGSCLDLASPPMVRTLAALTYSSPADKPSPLAGNACDNYNCRDNGNIRYYWSFDYKSIDLVGHSF